MSRTIKKAAGTSLVLANNNFTLTKTSLSMKEGTTLAEWEAMFIKLLEVEGSVQWWLGDHLRLGQITYEEAVSIKLSVPDGEDNLKYATLRNYKWVSDAIPVSWRQDTLGWQIHERIAALPEKMRKDTLKLAAKEEWSYRKARKWVRDWKIKERQMNPPPIPDGKYSVIYADPQWEPTNRSTN